ncbi:MAG TPA: hypothetical protein VKT73_06505 [Xanthobacteraceae bacterium]|nr:hypothetical protein [Xanthobacteraceae bacterium]
MRKSGTHSARALGKRSTGKRRGRQQSVHAPAIAICAFGASMLAVAYGLTHERAPASAGTQATSIATPKDEKEIVGTANAAPVAPKEDRIITGALPAPNAITPPVNPDAKQQAVVKKKKTITAKNEAPKTFFDLFTQQQKR